VRSWCRTSPRKPLGTRVVELLFGRGVIWLAGILSGVVILIVAVPLGTTAGAVAAVPVVLAAFALIRVNERIWIVGRRIMVRRERVSRRQMLAMVISISIVAGLTTGLGWIVGSSVRRSYEEQLRRRFRPRPKETR
jgi:hypothetical protein